jgi:hypothetical protein
MALPRPMGVEVTRVGPSYLDLSWMPVPGAEWYEPLVNGVPAGSVAGTTATLTGLVPRTLYNLSVRAGSRLMGYSPPSAPPVTQRTS